MTRAGTHTGFVAEKVGVAGGAGGPQAAAEKDSAMATADAPGYPDGTDAAAMGAAAMDATAMGAAGTDAAEIPGAAMTAGLPGITGRGRTHLPMRRALAALPVLLACCVPPWFVSGPIGYAPLGIAVFSIVLGYLYLRLVCRQLRCDQQVGAHMCERGAGEDVSIAVTNAGPLPVWRIDPLFMVADDAGGQPQEVRASSALAARQTRPFALGVTLDHVGSYRIGLREADVYDPLGLFRRTVTFDTAATVRVVPRVWDLAGLGSSDLTTSDHARSVRTVLSDDMDYATVREWRAGDPMKTVHWKMCARAGDDRLYTKLFESHTNPGTTVVLDFHCTEQDAETRMGLYDALLEAAFSIVAHARRTGVRTTLAFVDRAGLAVSTAQNDPAELGLFVDRMPRLGRAVPERAAADLMRAGSTDPDAQANVVLLCAELTDADVDAALELRAGRKGVRVICAVAAGMTDAERTARLAPAARLAAAQVPFATVERGEDVREAVMAR